VNFYSVAWLRSARSKILTTESIDISLQNIDSQISLSLDKSNFSAAANNFAWNVSHREEKRDERDI